MKKHYLLMATFASAMAFTACSNDDEPVINGGNIEETVVPEGKTITIAISNTGTGTTRAARPVTSSAADNDVNRVQLKMWVADVNGTSWTPIQLIQEPTGWDGVATDAQKEALITTDNQIYLEVVNSTGVSQDDQTAGLLNYDEKNVTEGVPGTDKHISKKATLRVWGLDANKKYRISAYGWTDTYLTTTNTTDVSDKTGMFQTKDILGTAQNKVDVEEVFATTTVTATQAVDLDLDGDGTIQTDEQDVDVYFAPAPSLTLTRQVAGILAYFGNVPAFWFDEVTGAPSKIEEIKVVASRKMENFYFPSMLLSTDDDFNGIDGTTTTDKENLLTFDMSEIATNYSEVTYSPTQGDAVLVYTFNKVDAGKVSAADNKLPFAEECDYKGCDKLNLRINTIFGGRYIIPYDKHYAEQTLSVEFWGEDGSQKPVLLATKDITNTTPNDEPYFYDIRCNHFYSIGTKMDTEVDDDETQDFPMDLSADEITLRVNDAWDVIHNMGIE